MVFLKNSGVIGLVFRDTEIALNYRHGSAGAGLEILNIFLFEYFRGRKIPHRRLLVFAFETDAQVFKTMLCGEFSWELKYENK